MKQILANFLLETSSLSRASADVKNKLEIQGQEFGLSEQARHLSGVDRNKEIKTSLDLDAKNGYRAKAVEIYGNATSPTPQLTIRERISSSVSGYIYMPAVGGL